MKHDIKTVAKNFKISPEELIDFALNKENVKHLGIENDEGFLTVSTSATEELIELFKQFKKIK